MVKKEPNLNIYILKKYVKNSQGSIQCPSQMATIFNELVFEVMVKEVNEIIEVNWERTLPSSYFFWKTICIVGTGSAKPLKV
jgi:hypothetical protein